MNEQAMPVKTSDTVATLLMVDDDPALLDSASELLTLRGFTVMTAVDGEKGLEALASFTPDVIISDIMMPNMDGYQFCKSVRANPAWTTIPFIFLTALGHQESVRKSARLGADAYLVKPFEADDLLAAVEGRMTRIAEIRRATEDSVEHVKHRLMTVFGHEVRTPLNQIYGYVHLLQDDREQYDQETVGMMLDSVRRGAERLTRLVEDMILMTNIESGLAAVEAAHYTGDSEVEPILGEVVQIATPYAEERKVTIEIAPSNGLVARCVPTYLRDIVSRVVNNAIKFSKPEGGRVVITPRVENGEIVIAVQDDGIRSEERRVG